ncbi:hypothetical protein M2447_002400, partial [Ereboglobus sp. PH5-10]|nr:hypothetical protein [Ereboglobus sp. PH5-10]
AKSPLKSTLASCFYPHSFSMPRWVNFCLDLPHLFNYCLGTGI